MCGITRQVSVWQSRYGEVSSVKVLFGLVCQLRLVQAARSPVRHGMAVKASWVALRYVLLCQGSLGSARRVTMRIGAAAMARPGTMTLVTSALGAVHLPVEFLNFLIRSILWLQSGWLIISKEI